MRFKRMKTINGLLAALCLMALSAVAAEERDPFVKRDPPPELVGRWNLKAQGANGDFYPSWLEVELSGFRTLIGRYVGQFGSARPISNVEFNESAGTFRFVVPPQWEHQTNDIVVEGKLEGGVLRGTTAYEKGEAVKWEGKRAPTLEREKSPKWGKAVKLFNGKDLSGWVTRHPKKKNGWRVENGGLTNAVPGNDLMTEKKFTDFKLFAKFRYPAKSNSGLYLRGRYELQIEDNPGKVTDSHHIGAIYGFLPPRVNAAKAAGEWQTVEIILVGRVVTVVLNGEPVIERQVIPGITGGALDSNEGEPGPIMIQGDHGPVEFKEVTVWEGK